MENPSIFLPHLTSLLLAWQYQSRVSPFYLYFAFMFQDEKITVATKSATLLQLLVVCFIPNLYFKVGIPSISNVIIMITMLATCWSKACKSPNLVTNHNQRIPRKSCLRLGSRNARQILSASSFSTCRRWFLGIFSELLCPKDRVQKIFGLSKSYL